MIVKHKYNDNFVKYCKEKLHDATSLTRKPVLILGWGGQGQFLRGSSI